MKFNYFWKLTLIVTLLAAAAWPALGHAQSPFSQGIASGEVTSTSAVLWTRASGSSLRVEVSQDPLFKNKTVQKDASSSADTDFTARVLITGLTPDQTYYYRWRNNTGTSQIGTFRTAPAPTQKADVRFAYSGDSDGTTRITDGFRYNNFESLDAAVREDADFFVYLGDTIYADSQLKPKPDETLDEFRQSYKVNREYEALRNLLRSTSTYAIWDDHEVRDNFAGQTVDPTLFANGRRAFLEYMPMTESGLRADLGCDGRVPFFRRFQWGADVDVIILDERTCRSPSVEAACFLLPGLPDPAPTLPPFLRVAFGLPPSPPRGCLDAIFAKSRTLLGTLQKAAFKEALKSKAKFKFVITGLAIQQFYALPYDRWEGYGAERNEILNFIRNNKIQNVIFLATDAHANFINEVFIDRFHDPQRIADEFVTGPIATTTMQDDLLRFLGPLGLVEINAILTIVGVDCRDLDSYSYGVVDVNVSAGTATIVLKDDKGNVLHDQLNPSRTCAKTIGSQNLAFR